MTYTETLSQKKYLRLSLKTLGGQDYPHAWGCQKNLALYALRYEMGVF